MQRTGFGKLPARDLINLHNSGVRASLFAEIHALGFGPYTPQEAVEMSQHGIRAATFAALKAAGITRLSAREAVEAAAHGLSAADIDQAREFGTNLGFAQIMKLKKAGVI
jgi:hypothetical protein